MEDNSRTNSDSGKPAPVGYAHSEYSLASPSTRAIISQESLPVYDENDDKEQNTSDEEVELCSVMLAVDIIKEPGAAASCSQQARARKMTVEELITANDAITMSTLPSRLRPAKNQYEMPCRELEHGVEQQAGCSLSAVRNDAGQESVPDEPSHQLEQRYEKQPQSPTEQLCFERQLWLSFQCPMTGCGDTVNAVNMLSHIQLMHTHLPSLELHPEEQVWLRVQPQTLLQHQSGCLALLMYRSGRQKACNYGLVPHSRNWNEHMPLLLMLRKTSWDEVGKQPASSSSEVANLYVFWVVAPQAQVPYTVIIGAGDDQCDLLRRSVLETCQSNVMMEDCDLLGPDPRLMRLTHGELKFLTHNLALPMQLEFTLTDSTETQLIDAPANKTTNL